MEPCNWKQGSYCCAPLPNNPNNPRTFSPPPSFQPCPLNSYPYYPSYPYYHYSYYILQLLKPLPLLPLVPTIPFLFLLHLLPFLPLLPLLSPIPVLLLPPLRSLLSFLRFNQAFLVETGCFPTMLLRLPLSTRSPKALITKSNTHTAKDPPLLS